MPYGDLTVVGVVVSLAMLVITDRLVWHTRLKAETARADRWEDIALKALATGASAGVRAAEVTSEVLSKLPDAPHVRGDDS
jgi:hypothetical protein